MITNEIYFFENQSSVSTSDFLYNVNDGTLILQVDGNVSNLELSVLGNTDLVDDDFVTLKTINASDYSMGDKITSTGIYWIDINGIRKIKLNLSKITGSVSVKAITKRGLTTDLVARAMAANASGGGSYTLPVASASTLGGIKVGENLTITEDGILSATGGGSGGINIAYTIDVQGTESNPTIIDRTKLKVGDYILVNASNTRIKFTDTTSGTAFLYNGLYQISSMPNNPSTENPCILHLLPHYFLNLGGVYFSTLLIYNYVSISTNEYNLNANGQKYVSAISFQNVYGWKIFGDRIDVPTPSSNDNATNKKYVDSLPTTYAGYDATKTQVLKNINGVLTWQDE